MAANLSLRNISNSTGRTIDTLAIFSFLLAAFLPLMALKFLHINIESPFETHVVIMHMFVITILLYAITLCTSYFPEIISNISLLSGSLAPVLLAMILFPGLGRFFLLIWVIFSVKLINDTCQMIYQLYKTSSTISDFFIKLLAHHGCHEETVRDSTFNSASTARNHRHAILAFPITVLLALMPLKFQSMNIAAPFETHSVVMSIFVVTTFVYAVALVIEAKLQTRNNSYHGVTISKISLLSGSLATVFLVLIIFPALGCFILLVWTLFLVKLIYDACQKLHQLYHAISFASSIFNKVLGRGGHTNDPRIQLPV